MGGGEISRKTPNVSWHVCVANVRLLSSFQGSKIWGRAFDFLGAW